MGLGCCCEKGVAIPVLHGTWQKITNTLSDILVRKLTAGDVRIPVLLWLLCKVSLSVVPINSPY